MRLLLSRALPLVLASVASARNILLTEQEASDRHLSVQERTCADEHSAVAVSGSGSFQNIGYGIDFTAHVCAAEDGRGHRAAGKVLNTQRTPRAAVTPSTTPIVPMLIRSTALPTWALRSRT